MKNLGIYVFSGTGNTLKCAEAMRKALSCLKITSGFHELRNGTEFAGEADLLLCYPIHGFNAPKILLQFCRELPYGNGQVWFLKTSGEPLALNDNSSEQMIRILQKKGYEIRGEFHYVMPYNMIFRHSDEMASLMWKTAQERIPEAAAQIAENQAKRKKPGAAAKWMSGLCRIEHWFYPKNGRLYHVDPKRCVKCMQCIQNCPTDNISYREGTFSFGGHCISCARCSFRCPEKAIHIGLLDFMRVTGPYDFTKDPEEAVLGSYCKNAYQRYFQGETADSDGG